jgi:hypothetical protein
MQASRHTTGRLHGMQSAYGGSKLSCNILHKKRPEPGPFSFLLVFQCKLAERVFKLYQMLMLMAIPYLSLFSGCACGMLLKMACW